MDAGISKQYEDLLVAICDLQKQNPKNELTFDTILTAYAEKQPKLRMLSRAFSHVFHPFTTLTNTVASGISALKRDGFLTEEYKRAGSHRSHSRQSYFEITAEGFAEGHYLAVTRPGLKQKPASDPVIRTIDGNAPAL